MENGTALCRKTGHIAGGFLFFCVNSVEKWNLGKLMKALLGVSPSIKRTNVLDLGETIRYNEVQIFVDGKMMLQRRVSMDADVMIGQIVLDEENIIREYGESGLRDMWACLDHTFNRVGAKRAQHNFYVSRRKTLSILFQMKFFLDQQWFSDNVRTLYWYNPANEGAEDIMKSNKGIGSLDKWDPACVAELATMV